MDNIPKLKRIEESNVLKKTLALARKKGLIFEGNELSQSLLLKWLRQVYHLNIAVKPYSFIYDIAKTKYEVIIFCASKKHNFKEPRYRDFKSYEEAMEFGLRVALREIKTET